MKRAALEDTYLIAVQSPFPLAPGVRSSPLSSSFPALGGVTYTQGSLHAGVPASCYLETFLDMSHSSLQQAEHCPQGCGSLCDLPFCRVLKGSTVLTTPLPPGVMEAGWVCEARAYPRQLWRTQLLRCTFISVGSQDDDLST